MLRRVRDFPRVKNQNKADFELTRRKRDILGINDNRVAQTDMLLLKKIVELFNGRPGLKHGIISSQ